MLKINFQRYFVITSLSPYFTRVERRCEVPAWFLTFQSHAENNFNTSHTLAIHPFITHSSHTSIHHILQNPIPDPTPPIHPIILNSNQSSINHILQSFIQSLQPQYVHLFTVYYRHSFNDYILQPFIHSLYIHSRQSSIHYIHLSHSFAAYFYLFIAIYSHNAVSYISQVKGLKYFFHGKNISYKFSFIYRYNYILYKLITSNICCSHFILGIYISPPVHSGKVNYRHQENIY